MSNLLSYQEYLTKNSLKDDTSLEKKKNYEYYQQYLKEHNAEVAKNQQLETIEGDKKTALRESDIATDRAKRYLHALALKNGMQGTGYAQAKASELYAQEASRRTAINNSYSIQKNTALGAYQTAINEAKATAANNIRDIEVEQAETDRAEVLAQLDSNLSLYQSGEIDYTTFSKYYNENKDKLDATKDSTIIGKYDGIITSDAHKLDEEAKSQIFGKGYDARNIEYFVQGLGSGRENDDIDLTLGQTSRDFDNEFDLLVGAAVDDDDLEKKLNKLSTGDESTYPNNKNEGWLNMLDITSNDKPGKFVVYDNELYIFTEKGWCHVKDDNRAGEEKRAIKKYLEYVNS